MAADPKSATKPAAKPVPPVVEPLSREERLAAWAKANQKYLALAGGAVGLIVLVAWFLAVSSQRKAAFARAQLEQAWAAQDAGNLPLASSELQRTLTAYGGTDAAFEARLSLNQTRLANGQTQLAVDDLRAALDGSPPPRLAGLTAMLLGAGLEELGQAEDAARAYERAEGLFAMDFQKGEALLAAARAYRTAGKTDLATARLQAVIDRYKETSAGATAEVLLAELQAPAG